VEAAQLILGHSRADTTQIYAEVNELKALEVAGEMG
jgi:site-specific recombinase XerD